LVPAKEAAPSQSGRPVHNPAPASRISANVASALESGIKPLEANDSIFEFVFPLQLGEDGSGEKGFETLDQNFYFPCRKGTPRHSRSRDSVADTSLCPGK
jgi:hypothetical protein